MRIRLGDTKWDESFSIISVVDDKTGVIDIFSVFDKYCVSIVAKLADNLESHRTQLDEKESI